MKKILKNAYKKLLTYKGYSKSEAGNILKGLKSVYSKYGLEYSKLFGIQIKYKCSICNRNDSYMLTGCNIPQSIEIIGKTGVEPNFVCRNHITITIDSFYKDIVESYLKSGILAYNYFIVNKPVNKVFNEKLLNIEDFHYKNELKKDSIVKILYSKYDIIAIMFGKTLMIYPNFEFTTFTKVIEYENRSYSVNFANYIPDLDITEYKEQSDFYNDDSEYSEDKEYSNEKQHCLEIDWIEDYNIEQYLSKDFMEYIAEQQKILRLDI